MTKDTFVPRHESQATDIGPIFNHVALQLYRQTWEQWTPERAAAPESTTRTILSQLMDVVNEETNEFISLMFSKSDTRSGLVEHELQIFFASPETSIHEGMRSGLVMPLKALHDKINADNAHGNIGYYWLDTIQPKYLVEQLRSKHFHAEILKLSNAPNGMYGPGSSSPSSISPFYYFEQPMFVNGALNPEAYQLIKQRREARRSVDEATRTSMGCPVRKSAYTTLGPVALQYCREFGVDPQEVSLPETSAIIAGCELLACAIEKYYKTFPDQSGTQIPDVTCIDIV